MQTENFDFQSLKEFHHESRCSALAIAPETSLQCKNITVCGAYSDFSLRVYKSDLQENNTVQVLRGHTSYINDVTYDHEGEFFASVSDDHSCRIWNCKQDSQLIIFYLKSAGISVKCHPDEQEKILVAEKNGLIHLFNLKTEQAILSLDSKRTPLIKVDWSLSNSAYIAALIPGEIVLLDLRRPSRPIETKQIHEDGGLDVSFSSKNEQIIASVGRPNMTLKVLCFKTNTLLIEAPLKLYGGMNWHFNLPFLAVAQDRKLGFWKASRLD